MNCADFREELRRTRTAPVSEGCVAHAASCPSCAFTLRGFILLRLGSSGDAPPGPGPGFEQELRSRLAGMARDPSTEWTLALGFVARPALTLAAAVFLVCLSLQGWLVFRSREADLETLAQSDPAFASLLAGDLGNLLEPGEAEEGIP